MDKDSEVDTTDREEGTDTPAPEDGEDSDDITTQLGKVKAGAYSGQICTLKTLIDDEIVKIGDAVLSLEYMVSIIILIPESGELLRFPHVIIIAQTLL